MAKKKSRHQRRRAAMERKAAQIEDLELKIFALKIGGVATLEALRDTARDRDTMAELAADSLDHLAQLNKFVHSYQGVIAAYNRDWEEAQQENKLRSAAEVRNWTYGEFWVTVSEAWNQQQLFHVESLQVPEISRQKIRMMEGEFSLSEFTSTGTLSSHFSGLGTVVVPCTIYHSNTVKPDQINYFNMVTFTLKVESREVVFRIRSGGTIFCNNGELNLELGNSYLLREVEGEEGSNSFNGASVYNFRPMHPKSPSDW